MFVIKKIMFNFYITNLFLSTSPLSNNQTFGLSLLEVAERTKVQVWGPRGSSGFHSQPRVSFFRAFYSATQARRHTTLDSKSGLRRQRRLSFGLLRLDKRVEAQAHLVAADTSALSATEKRRCFALASFWGRKRATLSDSFETCMERCCGPKETTGSQRNLWDITRTRSVHRALRENASRRRLLRCPG